MNIFCRIGLHAYRVDDVVCLPPTSDFPKPVYYRLRCKRCGKKNWNFV